jgi:hypothetical protein
VSIPADLADRLLAEGAPLVVIDPDVRNARAAFERAGFRLRSIVGMGDPDVALMIFGPQRASGRAPLIGRRGKTTARRSR